jgi:UDP-N-acetylmuramoyl-L-alanyl-D-glutamate--2,6-diaminopimelate ligase
MKEPAPGPPILVAGLGRAGEAALDAAFQATGPAGLWAWDASTAPAVERLAAKWRARGVEIALGGDGTHLIERLGRGGTIVKSPGIEFDIPLLPRAQAAGINCIDELEYGWRKIRCPVIGVTGTNGKSTTCALVAAVLRAASSTCQIAGNTEFGPPLSAASTGNDFVVCEVSSFQLEASPTFLPAYAIFTNLTPEHLTRHLTIANYSDIKSRMFVRADKICGTGIVNVDDPFGITLLERIMTAGGRALSYGFAANADVQVLSAEWDTVSARTSLRFGGQTHELRTRLPGRHNASNIAAAFAFGVAAGIDPATIARGLEQATAPPGRWQIIAGDAPFDVIVDYAHTPDGLMQVLATAQAIVRRRGLRLRTVFGPVGLPDPPKATGCAAALAAFSDHVILTTGSAPRSPRVLRIKELNDVIKGRIAIEIVLSRRAAIARAIAAARAGDIVAVLGLGALGRQIVDARGTMQPFDDRAVAASLLEGMRR